jgi:hypothetical protein
VNKELRKLLKEVEAQGFTWTITSRQHVFVRDAEGRPVTTIGGTISDHRGLRNAISDLKRAGFRPGG